jgi:hypothetical protein
MKTADDAAPSKQWLWKHSRTFTGTATRATLPLRHDAGGKSTKERYKMDARKGKVKQPQSE